MVEGQTDIKTEITDVKNEEPQAPSTIKLGDAEYTQDQLSKYVGLGKMAEEIETKYNTKIDRVWPEYTKTTQEVKQLKDELAKAKSGLTAQGQIDPQAAQQAKDILKQLGYMPIDEIKSMGYISRDEARQEVLNTLAARDLIQDTQSVINDYTKKGLPVTTSEAILKHMQENGFKNPEKAYKDMFEKEVDIWKEKEISSAKKPGLYTTSKGVSNKIPVDRKPKNEMELMEQVSEALNSGNQ